MTFDPSTTVAPSLVKKGDSDNEMAADRSPALGQLRYELSIQDYTAAARAMFLARGRFLLAVFAGCLAFIYLTSMAGAYYDGQEDTIEIMYSALPDIEFLIPFYIILCIIVYFVFIPVNTKFSLRGSPFLALPLTCDWSSDGMTLSNGRGSTRYLWADFIKIQDSASAILLYYSKQCFLILPKRAFATVADREAFEVLIKAKIVK